MRRQPTTALSLRGLAAVVCAVILGACGYQQAHITPPATATSQSIDGFEVNSDGMHSPPPFVLDAGGVNQGSCVPLPSETASEAAAVSLPTGQVLIVYAVVPAPFASDALPWMDPQSSYPAALSPARFCGHPPHTYSLPVIMQPFRATRKGVYAITFAVNPAFHAHDAQLPQLAPIVLRVTVA